MYTAMCEEHNHLTPDFEGAEKEGAILNKTQDIGEGSDSLNVQTIDIRADKQEDGSMFDPQV